jgi:hypothetical protein
MGSAKEAAERIFRCQKLTLNRKDSTMIGAKNVFGAVILGAFLLACVMHVGCSGSKSSGRTYEEFLQALGMKDESVIKNGSVIMDIKKPDLIARIGKPDNVVEEGDTVFLYYNVKGGTVTITLKTGKPWWNGEGDWARMGWNIGSDEISYAGTGR